MELEDVLWEDGQDNMGSIQREMYYCALSDLKSMPEVPKNPASLEEAVVAVGNFVFKTGKCFRRMYLTPDTGNMVSEQVGERDGHSFRTNLTAFHPGSKKKALGFARWMSNSNMIFVVKEANDQLRIVGTEQYPAGIDSNSVATGENAEGRKGMTFTVSCASRTPAPIYEGTIQLTEAAGSGSGSGA